MSGAVSAGTLGSIVEIFSDPDARIVGDPAGLLPNAGAAVTSAVRRSSPLHVRLFVRAGRLIGPLVPVAFLNPPVLHPTASPTGPGHAAPQTRPGSGEPGSRGATGRPDNTQRPGPGRPVGRSARDRDRDPAAAQGRETNRRRGARAAADLGHRSVRHRPRRVELERERRGRGGKRTSGSRHPLRERPPGLHRDRGDAHSSRAAPRRPRPQTPGSRCGDTRSPQSLSAGDLSPPVHPRAVPTRRPAPTGWPSTPSAVGPVAVVLGAFAAGPP